MKIVTVYWTDATEAVTMNFVVEKIENVFNEFKKHHPLKNINFIRDIKVVQGFVTVEEK
jgi:hypothetical protein